MQKRKLGDLEVSAIGMGCMNLSGLTGKAAPIEYGLKAIRKAYDMGITFFDTAEAYGPYVNEKLVGEAIKPFRKEVILATKFGMISESGLNSSPAHIRKVVDESLQRLQTDYIDLLYQHRVDPNTPIEEVALCVKDLIKQGKVRYFGLSEAGSETIKKAHAICPLTAIQNRYSMMYRDYETLFPVLEELNISLVAFSPLANGLLSDAYNKDVKFTDKDDFRTRMPQFTPEAYDANQELMEMIRTISKEKNCTPAQLSLAWMINKKPYIIPIPGTRKSNRLKENLESANVYLTEEEVAKVDSLLDKVPMSDLYGR